jgi:hypothetical protein
MSTLGGVSVGVGVLGAAVAIETTLGTVLAYACPVLAIVTGWTLYFFTARLTTSLESHALGHAWETIESAIDDPRTPVHGARPAATEVCRV